MAATVPPGTQPGSVPGTTSSTRPDNRGDCPAGMAFHPGRSFLMGSRADGSDRQGMVQVASFCLDVNEVTASAYDGCVKAGHCRATSTQITLETHGLPDAHSAPQDWQKSCTPGKPGLGNHPANCVSMGQAAYFCEAEGKRLPTNEEWEYAAKGGDEGRPFPWGDAGPGAKRVNACGSECVSMFSKWRSMYSDGDSWAVTAPVGRFPLGASRWGVNDLAGNVAEWTSSHYCPPPHDNSCSTGQGRFMVRGGAFATYDASGVSGSAAWTVFAGDHSVSIGFRCAKTLGGKR
jgi:formylglycine-generating enzyme required for sulfatase activity